MTRRRSGAGLLVAVGLALAFYGIRHFQESGPGATGGPATIPPPPAASPGAGADAADIVALFRDGRSGVMVESAGRVDRELSDDLEGSRHQRFVVRLDGGHTVLISHNIDLAPRVPLAAGDAVTFRGQYEWNERGGVVHWTHHDPDGTHDEGWIRHEGRTYE